MYDNENKKIESAKGNCGPISIQYITSLDEDQVLLTCEKYGYRPKKGGMKTLMALEALKDLGFPSEKEDVWKTVYTNSGMRKVLMTIRNFIDTYPKGMYLVAIRKHFLVIHDGTVIDPNCGSGNRTKVQAAYRVNVDRPLKAIRKMDVTSDTRFKSPNGNKGLTTAFKVGTFNYKVAEEIKSIIFEKSLAQKKRHSKVSVSVRELLDRGHELQYIADVLGQGRYIET